MNHTCLFFFASLLGVACKNNHSIKSFNPGDFAERSPVFEIIKAIPVPTGYERVPLAQGSFGEWLRAINLKKDSHVYLFDGSLKKNQSAQFAVLDITIGKKDLQQCADAVMRLRAEYLFDQKRYDEIVFKDNDAKAYAWQGKDKKHGFDRYLENVFGRCGTASLEKQLRAVNDWQEIQPGDVFIKGGYPGHAMMVVDAAINKEGQTIFMLAQSYMPAQDIHIVRNPIDEKLSPWYEVSAGGKVATPEWVFSHLHLRRW